MTLLYFLILTPLIVWLAAWICFRLLFIWVSKNLRKKLNIGLSISKIHLTYLEGISIAKEGLVSVNIDHIGFSSKWVNSQCNKPFTLYVGPFTVNILKTLDTSQSPRTKMKDTAKDKVFVSVIAANTIKFFLKHIGVVLQDLSVTSTVFDTIINWTSEVNLQLDGLTDIHNITFAASFMNCKLTALHNGLPLVYITHNLSVKMSIPPGKSINSMCHIWRVTNLHLDMNEDLTSHVNSVRQEIKRAKILKEESINTSEDSIDGESSRNKLHILLNVLPQGLKLSLENFKIVYRLRCNRELQMDWNCVLSWQRLEAGKHEAVLDILGFVINGTNHCKLLLFKQMMVKLNVYTNESRNRIHLFNKMDTCHIDFIYEEVLFWKNHFSTFHADGDYVDNMNRNPHVEKKVNSSLLSNTVIAGTNLFENCSCDLYICLGKEVEFSVASLYLGLLELDISEANLEKKMCSCSVNLTDLYSYIDVEDIIPPEYCPLPCQLEHDQPAVQPSSERHAWGRVFEVGKISLNCNFQPGYTECKCEVIFVALEWSLAMGHSILQITNEMIIQNDQRQNKKRGIVRNKDEDKMKVDVEVNLHNMNVFMIGEKEGGYSSLICKMDTVNITKDGSVSYINSAVQGLIVSQLRELSQMKTGDAFYCRKSNSFKTPLLLLPSISLNIKTLDTHKVIDMGIKETNVDWNPNVHMAVYEQICNMESFISTSKDTWRAMPSSGSSKSSTNTLKYTLNINKLEIKMDTTAKHTMTANSRELKISLHDNEKAFHSSEISLFFDDNDIFRFRDVEIKNVPKNGLSSLRNQSNLSDSSNSTWSIGLQSLDINFPYKFDFGDSLEKFQLIIKMLKYLHKKLKRTDYVEPLPPDLILSCEMISITFDDDPFEVHLGNNYMLLCDEIEQANEREQVLEEKLEQIKSEKGTMLPGKQIEVLREKLKVKNSAIYIERSKEMYEDHSLRKSLFLVEFKDVELTVLADSSYHGKSDILKYMKILDPDSAIPEDIQFTTLWCRMAHGKFQSLKMLIRDYPQPWFMVEKFSTRGMVIGSEACGVRTATREAKVSIGHPWKDLKVSKNMSPLKFYYDLKWDMASFEAAYGANLEPTVAMMNESFDLVSKASVDPSPPLPYWDKIRLIFHGNLKMDAAELTILMIASTDPHNTTEKLELEWSAATVEWTNGKVSIDGNFDMTTRTASKYDDSQVCHFPNFKMVFELEWVCKGDKNAHHYVYPTHPRFVQSEDHDSYAEFRSSNLNMNCTFETCMEQSKESVQNDPPLIFLYASTFRWFQHYRSVVINRVSRPIKRGTYFGTVKPRKLALGRHLKLLTIDLRFPSLNVTYWASFEHEIGFEATIDEGLFSVKYQVFISPHPDAMTLIRRPVANWIIRGLNSIMENVRVFLLQSSETKLDADDGEDETLCIEDEGAEKKHYLFSVDKLDYKRLSVIIEDSYTQKIILQNFRGAWTAINRELTFHLLEAYSKMQRLKKVLSSEALKLTSEQTTEKKCETPRRSTCASFLEQGILTKSPMTSLQSGHGISLLQQLVSEQSSKFMIQVDEEKADTSDIDLDTTPDDDEDDKDVLQRNWHIELVNSQVLLHGTETKGAIIVTSGNATILKRLHQPSNVSGDIVNKMNKVTWRGKIRNLQCFSTMDNFKDITVDNIPWLTTNIIISETADESLQMDPHDITLSFMKLSNTVGGFVEVPVGKVTHQLQRVIARCECEFRLINLDEELDPAAEEFVPESPTQTMTTDSGANTVDLKLGKLEMSTSNSQYAVIVDICQNLIFHTEQKKKEGQEKLEKMKFKLHLNTDKDLKGNVSQLQKRVRDTQMMLRHYEREYYNYRKEWEGHTATYGEESGTELTETMSELQEQIEETKEQLFEDVEELKILIRAYKDFHNAANVVPLRQKGVSHTRKVVDVLFDDLQWLLTKDDGQLGISHAHVRKFKYNQLNYKDNSVEHCFEVGHFALKNLLPDEIYREALMPHEVDLRRRLDKMVMLRVYCRISPAVAGIMVKDHFEVNVCPIKVQISHKLFHQMESFFFPRNTVGENAEQLEFKMGMLTVPTDSHEPSTKEDSDADIRKSETASVNIPPLRPPPPSSLSRSGTFRSRKVSQNSITSLPEYDTVSLSSRLKKSSHLSAQSSGETTGSLPAISPLPPNTSMLNRNSSFRRSNISLNSMKDVTLSAYPDRDVDTMKERAAKNQTFIYVKIPEVPVCFSYKGEKERNIEDVHNFNLCLPTLEYHSRTWTWQDLVQALKKDYVQTLVPQILKEKLHLKSAGADTKPSIAQVNDSNKARLLFGENQYGTQKKSAKKIFGKLLKPGKTSSLEKLSEPSATSGKVDEAKELLGKGVDPTNLEVDFKRLRDLGGDGDKQS